MRLLYVAVSVMCNLPAMQHWRDFKQSPCPQASHHTPGDEEFRPWENMAFSQFCLSCCCAKPVVDGAQMQRAGKKVR